MTHKQIAKDFLSMIISWNIQQAFDTYTGVEFAHHNHYTKPGKEELIKWMQWNEDAFPNKIFEIDMILQDDDRVATYSLMKFTPDHTGVRVVHIFRFVDDKIVEMRDVAMQLTDDSPNID